MDDKSPRKRNAKKNAEDQSRHRKRVQIKITVYEQLLADHGIDPSAALRKAMASTDGEPLHKTALRKVGSGQTGVLLRKDVAGSGDDFDEFLTEQRQHFDRVTDRYIKHASKLEEAHVATIRHKYAAGARDIWTAWKNARLAIRMVK